MRFSMWTYPWDVQDLTPDRVEGDLRAAGIDTIGLAASYHAGRFLQPRSPRRKTVYPEDGTIYFMPTPGRWSGRAIRPQVAEIVTRGGDVLADLVRRRDAGGLAVSCWTVCLHNSRLGQLHPEAVTRNAFGEPSVFNLCPSHPEVRAYAATLAEDLSASYRPDAIELETPGFMGWAHGFHHEKDGIGLLPEDDLFLSLCFCPACLERAAAAGLDGSRARETVRRLVADALERPVPEPRFPDIATEGVAAFAACPDLHDYLGWRFEPVTSLVAEIRDRTRPETKVYLIDGEDGWRDGVDLGAAAGACDGAILCAYDRDPGAVSRLVRRGRAAVGPQAYLGTAFRLFHPEMRGAADVVERTDAARAAGADGVAFYNYGLVPAARLDWVRRATGMAQTSQA